MKYPSTAAASPSSSESRWVEAELARTFLRVADSTQAAALLVIPVFVGVMWGETDRIGLLAWTLAALVVAALRWAALRHYDRRLMSAEPPAQLAYFERIRPLWPASGAVWAASALLFFDRASLSSQFICWLMLAAIAMLSVNGLASHLRTTRAYVNALMGVAMAVVAWRIVELRLQGPLFHWWLLVLLGLFWQVLLQAGRRLHQTHRRNFELQYRNSQLINSLTRQTQAALNAVEVKNRFLASATHDIRQPVHALGLYADWLVSEPDLVKDIAPKILESTKAVNLLFDSLFDMVRLDSGNIRLNLETVSLDKLLDELETQYLPVAQDKGLALRVRRSGGEVLSDALLMRRIVGNLVSNAIKYTPRGGVLLAVRHVRTGRPSIEVWDTGVGIAKAHHQEIFREFYKVPLHAGTEDGFGLGLYIVSRLSHILGHPVELASQPGRGTVFRLVLKPSDPTLAADRAASFDQLARSP